MAAIIVALGATAAEKDLIPSYSSELSWSGASMTGNVATWESSWGGVVFNLENKDYSEYKYVVIDFAEPTTAKTKLEVYYAAEESAGTNVEMETGAKQIKLNLDATKSQNIAKVALMSAKAATMTIEKAVLTDTYVANPVIWEGNTELVNMNTNFTVKADKLANAQLGDRLTVYFEVGTAANYGTIQFCYGWTKMSVDASKTNTKSDGNFAPTAKETSVTLSEQADVDGLLKSGLRLKGKNVIIKKIMLTPEGVDPVPPVEDPNNPDNPENPDDPENPVTPGDVTVLWSGSANTGVWAEDITVDAAKFTSLKAGDKIKVELSVNGGSDYGNIEMADQNYTKLQLDRTAAELDSYGCIQPDVKSLTYQVDAEDVALLKSNGLRVKGANITVTKIELIAGEGGSQDADEVVIWTGSVSTGVWTTDVTVDARQFAKAKAGDMLVITLKVNEGADFGNIELDDQNYAKLAADGKADNLDSYGCVQPEVTSLTYVIENGDIDLLKANGLRVKGANITIEQIVLKKGEALPPEPGPTNVDTIWTGSVNCGQWKQDVLVDAEKFLNMHPGDKLSIDLSINAGKGKGYVEVSAQNGTVLSVNGKGTNVDASGQITNRAAKQVVYVLDEADIDLLKQNGLKIRGFAITITKAQILYMESALLDEMIDQQNAPVEYYNLNGQRVENLASGLYIERRGSKARKVIIR